ncbi:uncharacterized protein [Paramormyrops kingsleyae]|uniref:uncharacterized protein isoform X3 n=1 Tax=Paramormyrops kingsleyae TaxID=1676925 RepID=UPI003B96B262
MFPALCPHQGCRHNKTMLSRNVLIFSAVMCLAAVTAAAPVEEKEAEESDIEREEGEEELSEEEEDDDDSNIQDMNMGIGGRQPSTASKDRDPSGPQEASLEGDPINGQKLIGSRPSHGGSHDVSVMDSAVEEGNGDNGADALALDAGTAFDGAVEHASMATQLEPPGGEPGHIPSMMSEVHMLAEGPHQMTHQAEIYSAGAEANGSEGPETESNGNNHKLLVGGSLAGHAVSDLPLADTFYGGYPDITDHYISDPNMDLSVLGLTPGEPAGSNAQSHAAGGFTGNDALTERLGLAGDLGIPQMASTAHPSEGSRIPGSFSDHFHSISYTDGGDHAAVTGVHGATTDPHAEMAMISHTEYLSTHDPEGGSDVVHIESSNPNGNGRQRPITEMHNRGDQPFTDHHDRISDLHSASHLSSAGGGSPHVNPHTGTDVAPIAGEMSSLNALSHMDHSGLSGEPVTSSHLQLEVTAPGSAFSSSTPDIAFSGEPVTSNQINSTGGAELHGVLFQTGSPGGFAPTWSLHLSFSALTAMLMPHGRGAGGGGVHLTVLSVVFQLQGTRLKSPPTRTPLTGFLLIPEEPMKVSVIKTLRCRPNQLFPQVNSTSLLVRVLKVQKMWNWRIPADLHIKPRVKIIRYRFQCKEEWMNRDPLH